MTLTRSLRLTADGRLDDRALLDSGPLKRLLGILNVGGDETRVAGGAVRDSLMGLPVADVDLAGTATPEVVAQRAKAAGLKVIPTGLAHGTVTVVVGGVPFEVTTLRRDVETDGRHAVVRFSRDFGEDARRRDFTINGLSLDAGGMVHDTVGGLADLAAGRVRFIGDAEARIREDYLRLLRFFRFHAAYGEGGLDAEGLAAAILHRDSIAALSRERVRAELLKLLAAAHAAPVAAAMAEAEIAVRVLGGPSDPARLARLAAIETARGLTPDPLLRLAALAVREADDPGRLREALRLSRDETRRLAEAFEARGHLDPARPPDRHGCLALLFACGERAARDGVMLAAAEAGDAAGWRETDAIVAAETRPRLPLGGDDVMARGVVGGRRVGAVLKRLQAAWIRAGFPREPSTLAALLDEAVAAEAPPR